MPREDHSENPPGIRETFCDMEKKNKNRSIATMERHSKPCEDYPVAKIMKHKHDKEYIHKIEKNNLPLKKRFGTVLSKTAILTYKMNRIKKKEDLNLNLVNPKNKEVLIVPGVIRHTSCPDNHLAYYEKK